MQLRYRVLSLKRLFYADGTVPRYNGNISAKLLSAGRYDYTYDGNNRLTAAKFSNGANGADFSATYTYDDRGNITSLTRKGVIDKAGGSETFGLLDNLNLSYSGNQLKSVSATTEALPFDGITGVGKNKSDMSLSYDVSGRLCADQTRGISSIEYDNDGHPVRIVFNNGNEQRDIWDGFGNHLATEYYDTGSMEGKEPFVTKRYAGDGQIEYQIGPDVGIPNKIVVYTAFPGGYFDQDGAPHYYITDYQGNNTAIVDSLPKIIEENNCYPYGEPWREKRGMPFLFSGNERLLLDGLNEYDFHARRYNAAIPAFTSWDALNEQYPWLSPYAYAAANPINFIDPSGQRIVAWEDGEEWEYRIADGIGGFYNAKGDIYNGNSFMLESLEEIRKANELGEKMINALVGSDKNIILKSGDGLRSGDENEIKIINSNTFNILWNPLNYLGPPGLRNGKIDEIRSPTSALAHELGHAYDYILSETQTKEYLKSLHSNIDPYEVIPCIIENAIRTSIGDPIRMSYRTIDSLGKRLIDKRQLLFYTNYDYNQIKKIRP